MNRRKLIGTIIGLFLYGFCIIFFTYAFYSWRSTNTLVNLNIEDATDQIIIEGGEDVNVSNIGPVLNYNDGVSTTFSAYNPTENDSNIKVSLNITEISNTLKNKSFKYILLRDTSGGTNYTEVVTNGNFENFNIGNNLIGTGQTILAGAKYTYKFIVYIDGNMKNDIMMQQNTLKSTLNIELVDVVISFDATGGVVTTTQKQVNIGESYGDLPTPTKTGYTFTGWYTEEEGGTQVTN